jgi:hypothetical protein
MRDFIFRQQALLGRRQGPAAGGDTAFTVSARTAPAACRREENPLFLKCPKQSFAGSGLQTLFSVVNVDCECFAHGLSLSKAAGRLIGKLPAILALSSILSAAPVGARMTAASFAPILAAASVVAGPAVSAPVAGWQYPPVQPASPVLAAAPLAPGIRLESRFGLSAVLAAPSIAAGSFALHSLAPLLCSKCSFRKPALNLGRV